jgi:hypothetical protein
MFVMIFGDELWLCLAAANRAIAMSCENFSDQRGGYGFISSVELFEIIFTYNLRVKVVFCRSRTAEDIHKRPKR